MQHLKCIIIKCMVYLQLRWSASPTYMVWPNCSTNGTRENNNDTAFTIYKSPYYICIWHFLSSIALFQFHTYRMRRSLQKIHTTIPLLSHRATGTLSLQKSNMWFLISHGGTMLVTSATKHCSPMETNISVLVLSVLEQ